MITPPTLPASSPPTPVALPRDARWIKPRISHVGVAEIRRNSGLSRGCEWSESPRASRDRYRGGTPQNWKSSAVSAETTQQQVPPRPPTAHATRLPSPFRRLGPATHAPPAPVRLPAIRCGGQAGQLPAGVSASNPSAPSETTAPDPSERSVVVRAHDATNSANAPRRPAGSVQQTPAEV